MSQRNDRARSGLRTHVLAMILALASAGGVHADDVRNGFYTGRLIIPEARNRDLAVSLCFRGSAVTGSYFDLNVGTDIPLRGTVTENGRLELEETDGKDVTARWRGEVTAYGGFRAARTPTRGRVAIVETSRTGAIPANSSVGGTSVQPACSEIGYQMARTGKPRNFRGIEPPAAAWFPRLVRFRDAKIAARINASLDQAAGSWFDEIRSRAVGNCEQPASRRPQDANHSYEAEVGVEYSSRDIFSVRVFGEFVCTEQFSTDQTLIGSLTYDLKTGERVSIDELFREDMTWEQDVIPLLFPYQLAEAAKPNAAECFAEYGKLPATAVGFHLAADGLVVQPIDLDVLLDPKNYCWQETLVPFAVLRAAARPGSVLERAAAAAPADTPVRYRIRSGYRDDGLPFTPPASRR